MQPVHFTIDEISGTTKYILELEGRQVHCLPLSMREGREFGAAHERFEAANKQDESQTVHNLMAYIEEQVGLLVPLLNKRVIQGDPFTIGDLEDMPGGFQRLSDILSALSNPEAAARREDPKPAAGKTPARSTTKKSTRA